MVKQGYKQTEVGVIPEDWDCVPLSHVLTIGHGKDQKQIEDKSGKYPILATGGIIGYTNTFLWDKPSALIGRKGTINKPQYVEIPFWSIDTLFYTKIFDTTYPKYIYYLFCTIDWLSLNEASGVPSLSAYNIERILCCIPQFYEQQRIAEALSDVDGMISSLEKLIAKKKAIKQGAMQELLTGKKRLLGFNEAWGVVKIKDVFEIYKGNGLSKEKLSVDGKYKCILYGELFTKYSEIIDDVVSKTNSSEGFKSQEYDVLMPGSTTTDGLDLATASTILKDNVLLGGDIVVLRPKYEVDTRIFGYLLPMKAKEILQHTQGITIVHLNTKSFKNMEVKIPVDFEEQKAIATILSDMDNEIEALEQKLAKTRQLKQGTMQQLLTGKIRLV